MQFLIYLTQINSSYPTSDGVTLAMTAPKGSSLTYLEPDVSSTSSSLTSESVTSSSTFSQRRHRLFVKSNKGCVDVAVINRFDDDRVTLNPFVEQAMEDEDAA